MDGNSHWAKKLNSAILNCHGKMKDSVRWNYKDDAEISSFESLFVKVAERIERACDFKNDLREKAQQ